MKSTLKNMVAVLFGITLVASAGVGAVNMITAEPIEQTKVKATEDAVKAVLTDLDFDRIADADTLMNVNNCAVVVYRALKGDAVAAYAVKTASLTKNGFNGKVTLMVGYTPAGVVNNVAVVEQNETPGLGTKMTEADNPLYRSIVGKNTWEMRQAGKLAVKKDDPKGEVDALTAATISSRAYVNAIEAADAAFRLARQADDAQPAATEQVVEQPIESATQEGGENE